MSLNLPLASPQYTILRTNGQPAYAGDMLVSLFANTVLLSGQTTTDLTTPASWGQFNYSALTGTYTNVYIEQSLLMGVVNDITQATYYGRVRLPATSSIIYASESSAKFPVGTYFWVINNYVPQYRLSRPSTLDPATAIELTDFDQGFSQPWPKVVGLQTAYAGYVDTGTNKLRLGFDASASYPVKSGDSISSYGYFFPAGATVLAGSTASAIVIVDLPVGEQWAQLDVASSAGSQRRYFGIKAHNTSSTPPDTGFEGGSIEGDISRGWTCTLPAFTGVDNLLPNTTAIVWRTNEQYGGTSRALYGGGSATITTKALTSNVVTLTTSATHPFAVGQQVIVAIGDTTFDGTYTITGTPTGTTFTYAKTHANVGSTGASGMAVVNPNNVLFVGWLQGETDNTASDPNYVVTSTANMTFTSIGPRLTRTVAQLLAFTLNASPTLWGQIVNLTVWRALAHFLQWYNTASFLCDITFDDRSDTFLFPVITTQGGNMYASPAAIAAQINALIEFGPAGQINIAREAAYLDQTARNNLTVVANWQADDGFVVDRQFDPAPAIGRADGDGLFYNSFSGGTPSGYTVRAPGFAQGESQGTATLSNQILAATSDPNAALLELEQRIGNKFEFDNLSEFLDIEHPAGYVALPFIPARSQVFTWTLDTTLAGPNGVNRIVYTTSTLWTIDSVRLQYSVREGSYTSRVRYRRVSRIGDRGANTTQPDPGSIQPALPDLGLPAFSFEFPEFTFPDVGLLDSQIDPSSLLTAPGKVAKFDGSELVIKSPTQAFYLTNFIAKKTPNSVLITPSGLGSYQIQAILVDPFSPSTQIGCYVLANNGSSSAIWYSPNVAASSPVWTKGATYGDTHTIIRAGNVAGSVLTYTTGVDISSGDACATGFDWAIPFDFTLGDQLGWHSFGPFGGCWYIWTGDGWINNLVGGACNSQWTAGAQYDFAAQADVRSVSGYIEFSDGSDNQLFCVGTNNANQSPFGGATTQADTSFGHPSVTNLCATPFSLRGGVPPGPLSNGLWPLDSIQVTWNTHFQTNVKLNKIIIAGNGTPPPVSFTQSNVRSSTDYGATVSSRIVVGNKPGQLGGFDVQRAGGVSYAAAQGAVYKASSLGGAYTSWFSVPGGSNPTCLIIPYYKRGSTTLKNTSTSTPDVVAACSNGKLYWIDGATAAATDITPSGMTAFDNANCVTTSYGTHLAVFGKVSGVYHLFTSTNSGSSWTDRITLTAPHFIRGRRGDNRVVYYGGGNHGQLYLSVDNPIDYSSTWDSAGMSIRNMPTSGIDGFDVVG